MIIILAISILVFLINPTSLLDLLLILVILSFGSIINPIAARLINSLEAMLISKPELRRAFTDILLIVTIIFR